VSPLRSEAEADLGLEEGLLLVLEPRGRQVHVVEGVPESAHTFNTKWFGLVKWFPALSVIRPITMNEWGFTAVHVVERVPALQPPRQNVRTQCGIPEQCLQRRPEAGSSYTRSSEHYFWGYTAEALTSTSSGT